MIDLNPAIEKALLALARIAKKTSEDLAAGEAVISRGASVEETIATTIVLNKAHLASVIAVWLTILSDAKEGGYAPSGEVLALVPKMEEWASGTSKPQ
jgi:hypothetical protein